MDGSHSLLAISSGRHDAVESLLDWASALARGGVRRIQVREKGWSDRVLLDAVSRLVAGLPPGVEILVNGRCDVADLSGASGVHLPAQGVAVESAREILGRDLVVGRSTHSLAAVREAMSQGVDYVVFGPVFEPLSKASHGPSKGLEALAEAASVGVPVYALGGVTIDRLTEIGATGAAGVAGITMFQNAKTIQELVERAGAVFGRGRT